MITQTVITVIIELGVTFVWSNQERQQIGFLTRKYIRLLVILFSRLTSSFNFF